MADGTRPTGRKAKASKRKTWAPLAPGEAARALAASVHYSSKGVNTNAAAVGVRLAADERVDLPWIALSTIDTDRRITDYIEGGAPKARPFNQAASVLEQTVDEQFEGCTHAERSRIQTEADVLAHPYACGLHTIDARLRQVLMPDAEAPGGYVSLAPLHSAPFSRALRARMEAEKGEFPALVARRVAVLGVGGANPQNVGRHVRAMQQPLVFDAPTESLKVRRAYAIYYRGVAVESLLARPLMHAFAHWRSTHRSGVGVIDSSMVTRAEEEAWLRRIALAARRRAEKISRDQDAEIVERLGARTDTEVDALIRALLEPGLRLRDWPERFALRLLRAIEAWRPSTKAPALAPEDALARPYLQIVAKVLS